MVQRPLSIEHFRDARRIGNPFNSRRRLGGIEDQRPMHDDRLRRIDFERLILPRIGPRSRMPSKLPYGGQVGICAERRLLRRCGPHG
jgi:hypothetical protein